MKDTILKLTALEVRNYFLQSSKFCTIDLPKYFDFQSLLNQLDILMGKNAKLIDIQDSKPNDYDDINYKFLTNKDGNFAWRPLQVINPAVYICLLNRITEHWEYIKSKFGEFQSNPNIKCYSIPLVSEQADNQLKTDVATNVLNWWEEIEQQSIENALYYKYVLVTDITDCYGSIYTHTIGWALHGKNEARAHRNIKPPTLIGCIIDEIIQSMTYRQTNGIPQGSVLMDFIAEMILGYADKELSKKIEDNQISNYQILRYRDDYRIFAQTEKDVVQITKLLSEVLTELNLKLNTHKTTMSSHIIHDVIKPDKWSWNEKKHTANTLFKHLLLIYSLAEKHPNSGSLSTALSDFLDRINSLEDFKEDISLKAIISILADIAYNNPRTYSAIVVCIGKLLSFGTDSNFISEMLLAIENKFADKPNVGHWRVWFQRLTIKTDRNRDKDSSEKLCQIAANNPTVKLWNISWLKPEYQVVFDTYQIFNEDIYCQISEIPNKNEVQLFGY